MSKKTYILFCCFIASLGGLLFGLDQGLMNGSLSYIQKDLHLSTLSASTFASLMLYGALVGSLIAGWANRLVGRKKMLILSAVSFIFFSLLSSVTNNIISLSVYRLILGITVGIASFTVPLYISESAPYQFRGGLITLYQLMITIGIFTIFCTNKFIASLSAGRWHQMFYPITITASIMLIGAFFIPESARWLILKNKTKKAMSILMKTRINQQSATKELDDIKNTLQAHSTTLSLIKNKYFIKTVLLGISLQLLIQCTGINAIVYYSTTIFQESGFNDPNLATIFLGLINVFFTIVAVILTDRLGRKPLLYIGLTLMLLALLVMALFFHSLSTAPGPLSAHFQYIGLFAMLIYIASFATSGGPLPWVICAEIFPLAGRELGITLTTATNWVSAALIVQLSLPMMMTNNKPNFSGSATLFLFFMAASIVSLLLTHFFVPETKDISLEKLENNLFAGKKLKYIGS